MNKSTGPDHNLHAAFLKHTAFETVPILTHPFQQSLEKGLLKEANITPIYKKGDKTDPGS